MSHTKSLLLNQGEIQVQDNHPTQEVRGIHRTLGARELPTSKCIGLCLNRTPGAIHLLKGCPISITPLCKSQLTTQRIATRDQLLKMRTTTIWLIGKQSTPQPMRLSNISRFLVTRRGKMPFSKTTHRFSSN